MTPNQKKSKKLKKMGNKAAKPYNSVTAKIANKKSQAARRAR